MITFQNKETNQIHTFYEKVNLVIDRVLAISLAKENFNNADTPITLGDGSSTPINELFQIKINVKGTGYLIANFLKDEKNEQVKEELFSKLKLLKSDGPISDESQTEKVRRALEILSEYAPLFISFVNNGSPILTKSEFNMLINKESFSSTILILMLPFDYILPPSGKEEKKHSFFQSRSKAPKQEKGEEPQEIVKGDKWYKNDLAMLKKNGYDYLFLILFTFIMSASFLLGLGLAFKGDMSGIFLFVISALFLGILGYALFSYEKSLMPWKYTLNNIKFPLISVLLGLVTGVGIGFLIATLVIKGTEENPLDYGKIFLISSLVSLGMSIVSLFIPELIRLFKNKILKK